MKFLVRMTMLALGLFLAWLLFWPAPFDPQPWSPPPNPGKTGVFAPNDRLGNAEVIELGNDAIGPEDVALGPDGALYTGIEDGRILRISADQRDISLYADTGGRPLGLQFDAQGTLIVADGLKGLLAVSPEGEVRTLVPQGGADRINFADDLDIGSDGVIWFSDASQRFGYHEAGLAPWEHSQTGRLLRHDPATGETQVVLTGLSFANGVALAHDESFVLVNETNAYRVTRYWLKGPDAGTRDVFMDGLPGFPDNLSSDGNGSFWIALAGVRVDILDELGPQPFFRSALYRLSLLLPPPPGHGWVIRADGQGRVTGNHQDAGPRAFMTTSVNLYDGRLVVGGLGSNRILRLPLND